MSQVESSMVDRIQCVRCSCDNQANRRFCNQCGEHLRQPCPYCSVECAVNEKFCGECGGDIDAWVATQREIGEQRCQSAMVLRESGELDKAINVLGEVLEFSHPALHSTVEDASLMLTQIRDFRDQQQSNLSLIHI